MRVSLLGCCACCVEQDSRSRQNRGTPYCTSWLLQLHASVATFLSSISVCASASLAAAMVRGEEGGEAAWQARQVALIAHQAIDSRQQPETSKR